jgi:predicted RNA-binding protein with PUA-like domain
MDYLLKTEPTAYSFADLQRDKSTIWDGVANPVALRNLREMSIRVRWVQLQWFLWMLLIPKIRR